MQDDLRQQYAEIGRERDAAGRDHDRERLWFWVRVLAGAWIWVAIGGAIMAKGFHMNAYVGGFYFPDVLERAQLWVDAGVLIGTTGAFATIVWGFRVAAKRGYTD